MSRSRSFPRVLGVAIVAATLSLCLAACSSGSDANSSNGTFTVRIAMGSTGTAVDSVFTTLKMMYEKKYPGRTLEVIIQDNNTYDSIGLSNLLTSRDAPDIYFGRPGSLLATQVDNGYAADITSAVSGPAFAGRYNPAA